MNGRKCLLESITINVSKLCCTSWILKVNRRENGNMQVCAWKDIDTIQKCFTKNVSCFIYCKQSITNILRFMFFTCKNSNHVPEKNYLYLNKLLSSPMCVWVRCVYVSKDNATHPTPHTAAVSKKTLTHAQCSLSNQSVFRWNSGW